ncbi:hypothetical protein [Spirobacillus cienkowskii]|uniref:hypothetical protein n=1 Tax=Spirobacillus cienkowskii TaxID=495820 RepID=UPI0030CE0343
MFRSKSPIVRKTDKMTSFVTVLWRYLILSSGFWVTFSIICFIFLYNPDYGTNSKIDFFSSWLVTFQFLLVIIGVIIFSGIIGAMISIPSIILKIMMKIRVDKKINKGRQPIILIYLSTYFPILFCVFSHIIVLLISTSTAPQYMRNWFDDDYKIYKTQQKIYSKLFETKSSEINKKWEVIAKKISNDSNIVFLLPHHIVNKKNLLKETRSLLDFENKWIINSATKESMISSILSETEFPREDLFSPIKFDEIPKKNNKSQPNSLTFIGINGKSAFNFNNLFNNSYVNLNIQNSWFNVFLNRLALSQPHLLFFFKTGFITSSFQAWKWEYLINNNADLLSSYLNHINSKDSKIVHNNFLLYLTEFEANSEKNLLSSIDWPNNIKNYEVDYNIKKIDFYLSNSIKTLTKFNHKNIWIVPYNSKDNSIQLGVGFSNYNSNDNLMTSEILGQIIFQEENSQNCHSFTTNYDPIKVDKELLQKNNYLLDTLNQKKLGKPSISNKYYLIIKDSIKYGVFCQSSKTPPYLAIKNEEFFSKLINYQVFKNLNYQIFIANEKKLKSNDKDQSIQNKNPKIELNLNNFYRQFFIYKIQSDNAITFSEVSETEYAEFIKNYGTEVKNIFHSSINYLIK